MVFVRVYAEMVEAVDTGVGAIRAALERAGLLDNALFNPEVLAELRQRLDAWEADVDSHLPFVVK